MKEDLYDLDRAKAVARQYRVLFYLSRYKIRPYIRDVVRDSQKE